MIAVDTNILVYAYRMDSPLNETAYAVVRELVEGNTPWAIPWPVIAEFLSVATHPKMYAPPSPLADALNQMDVWLASPSVGLLAEYPTTWSTMRPLVDGAHAVGPAVFDHRIAAICIDHGVHELWSADRALSKVPGLTVRNPLIEGLA